MDIGSPICILVLWGESVPTSKIGLCDTDALSISNTKFIIHSQNMYNTSLKIIQTV